MISHSSLLLDMLLCCTCVVTDSGLKHTAMCMCVVTESGLQHTAMCMCIVTESGLKHTAVFMCVMTERDAYSMVWCSDVVTESGL